ncbi:MAG: hypothetical protein ACOYLS_09675 [Polymorphobacter sp.]
MIARRAVLAAAAALPLLAAAPPTAVEEWTFLRSIDPDPAALIAFIEANWFAMDRIAVARGLFSHFVLYRADDADADWNVVVVVGYPDPRGYDGVREAFEAIRAAHRTVLIDGRDLKALGRITGSRRVVRR